MAKRRNQYEIWRDTFEPTPHPSNTDANVEGCMLETFGSDLSLAMAAAPEYVWTIVEGDTGKWYIEPGYHLVNREGYIICKKPFDEAIHGKKFQTVFYL